MPSSITEDDSHFEAVQEQMEKAQSSGGSVRSLFTSGYVLVELYVNQYNLYLWWNLHDSSRITHALTHVDARLRWNAGQCGSTWKRKLKWQMKQRERTWYVRVDSQHTDYYSERIHNLSYFTLEVLFIITSRVARSSRAPNPSEVEVLFFRAKSSNHNELPTEFYSIYSCWAHSHYSNKRGGLTRPSRVEVRLRPCVSGYGMLAPNIKNVNDALTRIKADTLCWLIETTHVHINIYICI